MEYEQVSAADVARAAAAISDHIRQTELVYSRALSEHVGVRVYLKCENLQRTGSFKIRGAYYRMMRLSEAEKSRGVVAASAGNHAQGVALAARGLGIPATVFMPAEAALPKVAATTQYGADVKLVGDNVAHALEAAKQEAEATGKIFIHPYDHRDVIAGQGTVAHEVLAQLPDVRTIIAPVGGGGLVAGLVSACQDNPRHIDVVGVQAARFAAFPASLAAGKPQNISGRSTMADGISVSRPGDETFQIIQQAGIQVLTVDEEDISTALLHLIERSKLVVEPSGSVGVAALLSQPERFTEGPICVVLSGGNVDPLVMLRIIRHGLVAAGRYLNIRVRLIDRPGALAQLVGQLAEHGGNVMHVDHVRTGIDLSIDEVEVGFQVETKGQEHCRELLRLLRSQGYDVLS